MLRFPDPSPRSTLTRAARTGFTGVLLAALTSTGLVLSAAPASAAPGDVTVTVDVGDAGAGLALLFADIAAGPDGNLWTTNVAASSISRVPVGGGLATTFATPTAAGSPTGIVAGPDGAMWFTYGTSPKIGRITMAGAITEYPLPSGTGAFDLAVGPDGNLWYTGAGNQKIGRMTTSGAVTEFATGGLNASFITNGPDGSNKLYVAFSSTPKIGVITASGNLSTVNLGADVTQPWYIRTVRDSVWFIEQKAAGFSLARLVSDSTVSETVIPAANPTNIVPTESGAFWVLDYAGSKVLQMSSAGALQASYALPLASISGAIGSDGNLWLRALAKVQRMLTGQVPTLTTAPGLGPVAGVVVGTVISTSNGAWKYLPTSYTYQWQRCTTSDSATCAPIAGATGASYAATTDDNAKYVRSAVTAVNTNGSSAVAYSALLAVGSAAPAPAPAPPAPATGPEVAIGSGVVAELDGPSSVRRRGRAQVEVTFSALDVQGTVTFTFSKGSKSKRISNVPVAGGEARTSWRVPRTWPRGTTTIKATFTPSAGSPYSAGNMKRTIRVR
jgi:virginiamycin B lyase